MSNCPSPKSAFIFCKKWASAWSPVYKDNFGVSSFLKPCTTASPSPYPSPTIFSARGSEPQTTDDVLTQHTRQEIRRHEVLASKMRPTAYHGLGINSPKASERHRQAHLFQVSSVGFGEVIRADGTIILNPVNNLLEVGQKGVPSTLTTFL